MAKSTDSRALSCFNGRKIAIMSTPTSALSDSSTLSRLSDGWVASSDCRVWSSGHKERWLLCDKSSGSVFVLVLSVFASSLFSSSGTISRCCHVTIVFYGDLKFSNFYATRLCIHSLGRVGNPSLKDMAQPHTVEPVVWRRGVPATIQAVSYTHLTLPPIYSV